jgi:hypothetical protein
MRVLGSRRIRRITIRDPAAIQRIAEYPLD